MVAKLLVAVYTILKWTVLAGLLVGFCITRQCNDQAIEACKALGECEDW